MKGQKMTATERKRRERQRRREAGFVEVKLWALPQHHAAIKAFARALADPVAASTCTDPVAGKVPLAVSVDPVAVNTTGG
jgi:hypothetical protein